jgi:hypothetical protein
MAQPSSTWQCALDCSEPCSSLAVKGLKVLPQMEWQKEDALRSCT